MTYGLYILCPVACADVRFNVLALLLLIHCLLLPSLFVGIAVFSLICYTVLSVLTLLFPIILMGKRELVALL